MSRVVLAMSGGVDSSASAWLLKQEGHEVIGLFMRSGATDDAACRLPGAPELPVVSPRANRQGCCSASDAADARRVADSLGIPFHALNFRDEFGRIKDYFADEYLAGRTPNPCVMCNVWLKFGRLWDFARQVGAEFIATGHYAQVRNSECGVRNQVGSLPIPHSAFRTPHSGLFRGRDRGKDQSYVLFGIRASLLDRILFPVGGRTKPEIRALAREAGLRVADKPDSQEICFIPDNDYGAFLERHRGRQDTAGELVDTAGNVVGRHRGVQHFTIGQRKGLGVTFGAPRFVVRIEPDTRRVVIGTREELGRTTLDAGRANWLIEDPPARLSCTTQIRYQHGPAACDVEVLERDRFRVRFAEPQYGVAPGQAVVLYDGDRVLGGGWID
jgi:tRNA-specific 2-thiouridylase